ncbi:hypothetical protein DFH09DRAFT_1367018 [Mycena vulgaris]|nr:hypothetical protein DFH09DRAFT_1367018 [Mycena vulgaris]
MVLTRRAYKAISRWLPNEIITEIVRAAPPNDQASLCRVSKLFRGICLPILYRAVGLATYTSLVAFCSTISSNSLVAQLVRSFEVSYIMVPPGRIPIGRLFVDSSKALLRLRGFSIPASLLADGYSQELLGWTFPHLVRCRIGAHAGWSTTEEENTLASFLFRHPGLKTIRVEDFDNLEVWSSAQGRIPLLHLQHLKCPVAILPSIRASNLTRVTLEWHYSDSPADVERTIIALQSMTRPDIPFICSNDACDNAFAEIMTSLSIHIPHLRTLHMRLYWSSKSNEEIIGHVMKCLPRFTSLIFFSFQIVFDYNDTFWDTEAEDQTEVQGLGDACPTLEACCLNRCAWRKVNRMWEKYPLDDFTALAGLKRNFNLVM